MLILEDLGFDDARVVSLTSYPSDQGPKCVLILAASLMPLHAEALGCAYIYKDGVPVADLDSAAIDGKLRDMELRLPSSTNLSDSDTYFPELIHKFKVKRVADAKYEVSFRVHEAGRRADLESLLTAINKDIFPIFLKPRQGTLFEGGTRVEMSEDTPENPAAPMEIAILEDASVDRSYENKPIPSRGKGRPKGSRNKVVEIGGTTDLPVDENKEWDKFYDEKAGEPVDAEMLDILGEEVPVG